MSAAIPFEPYQGSGPIYRGMQVTSAYIQMRDGVCLAADVYLPGGLPGGSASLPC